MINTFSLTFRTSLWLVAGGIDNVRCLDLIGAADCDGIGEQSSIIYLRFSCWFGSRFSVMTAGSVAIITFALYVDKKKRTEKKKKKKESVCR